MDDDGDDMNKNYLIGELYGVNKMLRSVPGT